MAAKQQASESKTPAAKLEKAPVASASRGRAQAPDLSKPLSPKAARGAQGSAGNDAVSQLVGGRAAKAPAMNGDGGRPAAPADAAKPNGRPTEVGVGGFAMRTQGVGGKGAGAPAMGGDGPGGGANGGANAANGGANGGDGLGGRGGPNGGGGPNGKGGVDLGTHMAAEVRVGGGGGSPLSMQVRGQMEASFGVDFSGVRVHAGADAAAMAASVDAKAFTHGQDIFFAKGQFAPGSTPGKELLAHELTHVVQQGGGASDKKKRQNKLAVSSVGDSSEREADATAAAVTHGRSVGPISGAASMVSRKAVGSGGGGVKAAIRGFAQKKPSQRAKSYAALGGEVNAGMATDVAGTNDAVPEMHAKLGVDAGKNAPAPNAEKKPATGRNAPARGPAEPAGVAPAAPVPSPTHLPSVAKPAPVVNVPATATPEQGQAAAKQAFAGIKTDVSVSTSAGPRPKVPRAGDGDPSKTETQRRDTKQEADAARTAARQEVLQGRGPETIQPKILDQLGEVKKIVDQVVQPPSAVEQMDAFTSKNLTADVVASFDQQQEAIMNASMQETEQQISAATAQKETDSQATIDKATADVESLNAKAQAEHDASVEKAKGDITAARDETVAAQEKAVADFDRETQGRQRSELDAINARIAESEAQVAEEFGKAEAQANAEVGKAEKEAEQKKREEEEKANNRSWWDRVKDAVSSVFEAITNAINKILDAVLDVVKGILDKVKSLATQLIDAACKWVTDRIKEFASFLKEAVTALLGSVFPELAAKLNQAIDAAAEWACAKVEQVAEGLKSAVNAVCDYLASALEAVIGAFKAAVNLALAVMEAALTGDWAKVGLKILEAVLSLAGIPKEEFYAVIGKVEATIDTIVDDPGAFVGNVIDAVGLGFGQFGNNFLTHLQSGFVTWITQAAAAAAIPTLGSLELGDIFGWVMGTLGIDRDYIRGKAVRLVGEKNVERVEGVMDVLGSAMEGGWDGLWEYMQGYVDGLYDLVIGQVQDFILTRVVQAAVIKIASMFNPVGAIVQAIITAWNVYQFLKTQIQRIWGVVTGVIDSIADIANGNIQNAANLVEGALAQLVPLAIDLLARVLGLSGIPQKVGEIVRQVRDKIDKAIDKVIDKIAGTVKKAGDWLTGKNKKTAGAGDPGSDAEKAASSVGVSDTPIAFTAGGENHRLWVDFSGGAAVAMVASTPTPVQERVQVWRTQLASRPKEEKEKAGKAIGRVIAIERAIAKMGTPTKGDKKAEADLEAKKKELASAAAELFDILPEKLATEAAMAVTPEMTLASDNYLQFKAKFVGFWKDAGLEPAGGGDAEAERAWLELVRALFTTQKDLAAMPKDENGRSKVDLSQQAAKEMLAKFNPVMDVMLPAARKLHAGGKRWAFWSGAPAMEIAKANADVALESSAVGGPFDGLRIPRSVSSIQMWFALSQAYATMAAKEMGIRQFSNFLGAGSNNPTSVFNNIESPALKAVANDVQFTYYGCLYLPGEGKSTPDTRFTTNGVAGAFASSIGSDAGRGAMAATASKANDDRQKLYEDFLAAGASVADARAALAPGWESRKPPSGPKPVVPADVKVDATPRTSGLGSPVGGLDQHKREGVDNPVRPANGDDKADGKVTPPVPVLQGGGPTAAVGQGNGSGKVEDAKSLVVGGHASTVAPSAEPVKGPTEVSRHADGPAPANFRGRIEATVPSGPDDPGHSYHVLDDGTGVAESTPKRLKQSKADAVMTQVGLSAGALKAKKTKSPKDTLKDSGEMSAEEIQKMESALKKNPRSEEKLDEATGKKTTVAKADKVDSTTGKPLTNGESTHADSAASHQRAPMTEDEKEALLKGHAVLAKDNKAGADMRKVIPNNQVGQMLAGQQPLGGAQNLGASVRGSIGHQRNTDGMNAEQTVAALGLDYEHSPSDSKKVPGKGKVAKGEGGNFTEMDDKGKVKMSQEVENKGLHYIDFKMTKEMEKGSGVAMSQDLIDKGKTGSDPRVRAMAAGAHAQEKKTRDDPFAATGATSSNALVQRHGADAGKEFNPVLNQELNLNAKRRDDQGANGKAAFELPEGSQMKKRGDRAGEDKTIATLTQKKNEKGEVVYDSAGKPILDWEINKDLERQERGGYKNRMDKAKSDANATARQPGEDDASYNARMDARKAKIAASKAEEDRIASTSDNPHTPGSAEWKAWNRQQKKLAKQPATDSGATPTSAPAAYPASAPVAESAPQAKKETAKVEKSDTTKKADAESVDKKEAVAPELKREVAKDPVDPKADEHKKISAEIDDKAKKLGDVKQSTADIDKLYAEAEQAYNELRAATGEIAASTGGAAKFPPGLKGRDRAMEKIQSEYKGDASKLFDIARSSIEFTSLDALYKALDMVQGRFTVVRIKDRFQSPTKSGYRDMLLNLKASNGHVVEMQLHVEQILAVKSGEGHKLYEETRSIEANATKENRPLTEQERNRVEAANTKARGLYDAAFVDSVAKEGPQPASAGPAREAKEKVQKATVKDEPKPVRPPKDYPEPEVLDQAIGGSIGADTKAGPAPTKQVAPNPGLRKEHEGTGVEYAEMKGQAFAKGDGDKDEVDANDVRQGSLGDCYLIGGMAAVARANPQYIRNLIRENGDGTYDVTLYIKGNAWDSKGKPTVVTVDSKFPSGDRGLSAKYAKAGDRGPKGPELWVMLIEKAWAVHKGTYTGIEGGKVNDDGKFAGAIALLTNLNEGYYTPGTIEDKRLAAMIDEALKRGWPVACDSKNLDKESAALKAEADKAGVVGNHAYAPERVDLQSLTVDLQNPWGSSHVPGLKISDFKKFYRGLRIGK